MVIPDEVWAQLGFAIVSLAIAVTTWVTYRIKQAVDANAKPVKSLAASDRDLAERLNVLEGRIEFYIQRVNELTRLVNVINELVNK